MPRCVHSACCRWMLSSYVTLGNFGPAYSGDGGLEGELDSPLPRRAVMIMKYLSEGTGGVEEGFWHEEALYRKGVVLASLPPKQEGSRIAGLEGEPWVV